jgi:hypothetical protein
MHPVDRNTAHAIMNLIVTAALFWVIFRRRRRPPQHPLPSLDHGLLRRRLLPRKLPFIGNIT